MTTMQTSRTTSGAIARPPAHAPGAPPPGVVTIDPLRVAKKYKWLLIGAVIAGIAAGVAAHFGLMTTAPVYTGEVIWECYPQEESIENLAPSHASRDELDKFMATQAQIMMSTAVVDAALTDPLLSRNAPEWYNGFVRSGSFDSAGASRHMDRRLRASVLGETQLIRLSYWTTRPRDAAAVVNVVAQAYERNRAQQVNTRQRKRNDLLLVMVKDLDERIASLQGERDRMIDTAKIDSLDDQINEAQGKIRMLSEKLVDLRADLETYLSQLEALEKELQSPTGPTFGDDIRAAVESDPVIQTLRQQINLLEARLQGLREDGYGPDHMVYRSTQTQLNGIRQSYDGERERMMRRLFDGQIETLKRAINSFRAAEDDMLTKLAVEQLRGAELSKTRAKIDDIKDEINHLQEAKTKLSDDLNNLKAMAGLDTAYRILKLQQAQEPREVTFPKIYLMVPAGVLVVFGLVLGIVLLIEVVDQRVKGPSDIQMISRTRVLGLVPHAAEAPDSPAKVETVYRDQPAGVLAESYRQLCGTVLKQMASGGHKSLLVLSAMPSAGSTTTVCNLAYVMAAAEHKVLIVDANLRRPMVAKTLGLQDTPGLSDVLAGGQPLASAVQGTDNPLVSVLAAGSAGTRKVERLATPAMTELLKEAAKTYDVILVDVAPAVVAGDAMALANRCDASLLVVRAMREKRGMVARLRNELAETRADFLGVIVNAARSAAGGYLRGNIRATHEYQSEPA